MSQEQDKIWAMVEEGTITAAEAQDLLTAMNESNDRVPSDKLDDFNWPDMPAREQVWRRSFSAALLGTIFGGTVLLGTRGSGGLLGFIRRFVFWPLTLFAAIAAVITYFSKGSPWLHVRVQSAGSPTFVISLPFPAAAINKALAVARQQAPNEDVREKIDAAAAVLAEMDTSDLKDPLVIDINDEGDRVQVFLG
jgi:hypothetical protein